MLVNKVISLHFISFFEYSKIYQFDNISLNFFISLGYQLTDKKCQKMVKLIKKTYGYTYTWAIYYKVWRKLKDPFDTPSHPIPPHPIKLGASRLAV